MRRSWEQEGLISNFMKKELSNDEYLGAVRVNGKWHFFADFVGEWILDYPAYDPDYEPSQWSYKFRNGLLVVDETNANEFLEAMRAQELSFENVKKLVAEKGKEQIPLTYVVDFDERKFVDGNSERDIAEYVPKNWTGIEDTPLKYVPDEIKSVWTQNNN